MSESGELTFADDAARLTLACAIAGAIAECSVARLTVQDPRACMPRTLLPRESNLPRALTEAEPGTTFSAEGVALLVDAGAIRWVANPAIAARLRAITPG